VAETLKQDGFKVKVRGRGHRPFKAGNNNPYDYVPLTQASHATVYILNAKAYDEQDMPEPEVDPRLQALINSLNP
jgi:hypothetical protein